MENTSKLILNPEGKLNDNSQPKVNITYNNVTIELSYDVFRLLKIEGDPNYYAKIINIFELGKNEIEVEMRHDVENKELNPLCWFRDNKEKCSLNHIWNCPSIINRDNNYIINEGNEK